MTSFLGLKRTHTSALSSSPSSSSPIKFDSNIILREDRFLVSSRHPNYSGRYFVTLLPSVLFLTEKGNFLAGNKQSSSQEVKPFDQLNLDLAKLEFSDRKNNIIVLSSSQEKKRRLTLTITDQDKFETWNSLLEEIISGKQYKLSLKVHPNELGLEDSKSKRDKTQSAGVIGAGAAGEVVRAIWKPTRDTGSKGVPVAVKMFAPVIPKEDFETELDLMIKLQRNKIHPCITQLLGYFYSGSGHNGRFGLSNSLILPLKLGSLDHFIEAPEQFLKRKYSFAVCLRIAINIASGMHYLHSQDPPVIHRDLKPGNILLNNDISDRDSRFLVQITDFGESKQEDLVKTKRVGTPLYMAPECFSGQYTRKVDVYSFAMLLWQLVVGKKPWGHLKHSFEIEDYVRRGERPLIPERMPQSLVELISKCWHNIPESRPTFESILTSLQQIIEDLMYLQILGNHPYDYLFDDHFFLPSGTFHFTHELAGRKPEIKILNDLFDVSTRKPKKKKPLFVFLTAFEGQGRSTLLNTFQSNYTNALYFRFNQDNRKRPYSAFLDTLNSYFENHLNSEEDRNNFRKKLTEYAGKTAVTLFPVLNSDRDSSNSLTGANNSSSDLLTSKGSGGGRTARGRRVDPSVDAFSVCSTVIQQILRRRKQLIFLIDDFHLADDQTMNLIQSFIQNPSVLTKEFALIASYRGSQTLDQATTNLPSLPVIEKMITDCKADSRITCRKIEMKSLNPESVGKFITSTFPKLSEKTNSSLLEFSYTLWKKTFGNPSFIRTVLHNLHSAKKITFDSSTQAWDIDWADLQNLDIRQMLKLPTTRLVSCSITNAFLEALSCFGMETSRHNICLIDSFYVRFSHNPTAPPPDGTCTLPPFRSTGMKLVVGPAATKGGSRIPSEDLNRLLSVSTEYQVIRYHEETEVLQFIHEQVWSSYYNSLKPTSRVEIHLEIAQQLLLETQTKRDREDLIHEAVKHYRSAITEMLAQNISYTDHELSERMKLFNLILLVVKQLNQSSSFVEAHQLIVFGIELCLGYTLPESNIYQSLVSTPIWESHFDSFFDGCILLLQLLITLSRKEETDQVVRALSEKTKPGTLDYLSVYSLLLVKTDLDSNPEEGLKIVLQILENSPFKFEGDFDSVTTESLDKLLAKTKTVLNNTPLHEYIEKLPWAPNDLRPWLDTLYRGLSVMYPLGPEKQLWWCANCIVLFLQNGLSSFSCGLLGGFSFNLLLNSRLDLSCEWSRATEICVQRLSLVHPEYCWTAQLGLLVVGLRKPTSFQNFDNFYRELFKVKEKLLRVKEISWYTYAVHSLVLIELKRFPISTALQHYQVDIFESKRAGASAPFTYLTQAKDVLELLADANSFKLTADQIIAKSESVLASSHHLMPFYRFLLRTILLFYLGKVNEAYEATFSLETHLNPKNPLLEICWGLFWIVYIRCVYHRKQLSLRRPDSYSDEKPCTKFNAASCFDTTQKLFAVYSELSIHRCGLFHQEKMILESAMLITQCPNNPNANEGDNYQTMQKIESAIKLGNELVVFTALSHELATEYYKTLEFLPMAKQHLSSALSLYSQLGWNGRFAFLQSEYPELAEENQMTIANALSVDPLNDSSSSSRLSSVSLEPQASVSSGTLSSVGGPLDSVSKSQAFVSESVECMVDPEIRPILMEEMIDRVASSISLFPDSKSFDLAIFVVPPGGEKDLSNSMKSNPPSFRFFYGNEKMIVNLLTFMIQSVFLSADRKLRTEISLCIKPIFPEDSNRSPQLRFEIDFQEGTGISDQEFSQLRKWISRPSTDLTPCPSISYASLALLPSFLSVLSGTTSLSRYKTNSSDTVTFSVNIRLPQNYEFRVKESIDPKPAIKQILVVSPSPKISSFLCQHLLQNLKWTGTTTTLHLQSHAEVEQFYSSSVRRRAESDRVMISLIDESFDLSPSMMQQISEQTGHFAIFLKNFEDARNFQNVHSFPSAFLTKPITQSKICTLVKFLETKFP